MKWGEIEIKNWSQQQIIKRSYQEEVVSVIQNLKEDFSIRQYGALSFAPDRYPLFLIESKNFDPRKKTILITGGVHGYETSGVHGALGFFQEMAGVFLDKFNFISSPCISPWSYETINRWNPRAIDPNRSFYSNSPAEECELLLNILNHLKIKPFAHFDLHETTDTDNTVFRPALSQRDGVPQDLWEIPDGFYLVADTHNPQPEFQRAIIESVKKVTHIAPSDENGCIIGEPLLQEGVILYDVNKLNLCVGLSPAPYTTTTEVYPDSPKATPEICIRAQVSALEGGLKYLLKGLIS